jgi:hypothetical protein
MPDSMISLLTRFLEQNDGKLSNRAKEQEFVALTEIEILDIENSYQIIFKSTT